MHLDELPLSPEMLRTRSVMRSVEVDGTTLRIATTEGEPGQVPLVMFNGIGANLELLEPFVDELDARIPTLRFDAPGIGGSPTRYFPYRFAGLARTIDKLCDQLGYKEVDVFGISWGGAMAQEFVRRSRHRCRRLVLAATSAGAFMIPAHPKVLIRMASPLRYIKPSYMEKISPIIYGGDFRNNPELATEFTRLMRAAGPVGYFQQMFAGLGWTSIHWLPFLKQPVLLMAGSDDPIIPLINAKIMAKLIPKSKLVTYDCGHLFLFTRMEKSAREVEKFLLGEKPFG